MREGGTPATFLTAQSSILSRSLRRGVTDVIGFALLPSKRHWISSRLDDRYTRTSHLSVLRKQIASSARAIQVGLFLGRPQEGMMRMRPIQMIPDTPCVLGEDRRPRVLHKSLLMPNKTFSVSAHDKQAIGNSVRGTAAWFRTVEEEHKQRNSSRTAGEATVPQRATQGTFRAGPRGIPRLAAEHLPKQSPCRRKWPLQQQHQPPPLRMGSETKSPDTLACAASFSPSIASPLELTA